MLSLVEVAKHDSIDSCWVIVAGQAYDVTEFLDEHPGGASVILRFAGKDATAEYEPLHAPGTIENNLSEDKRLGPVEAPQTESDNAAQKLATTTDVVNKSASPETGSRILSLSECQCLEDLEQVARAKLPERARTYFESAAETHSAFHSNRASWSTLRLRPRVLRDVSQVSMRCRIMGAQSSLPIFIAPAAAARLGHPDGELCLARGAARMDIPQCVCTYASVTPKDVMAEFRSDPHKRGGALFFQLYVPKEKKGAEGLMAQAKAWGYEALLLTVDTNVIGKRDDDDKLKARLAHEAGLPNSANSASSTMTEEEEEEMPLPPLPGQEPGTLRGVHNPTLAWEDLAWIRKCWGSDRRIILKGIQTAEDALEATRHDIDGIYISNHGGRQLDYAPSPVEVLFEIRKTCPEVFDKLDVYVDGGIRRGTDIIKALCLGARAVGIGRGFMYALSAYGTDGVVKAISILSDEIQTAMRLLGVTAIDQLSDKFIAEVDNRPRLKI